MFSIASNEKKARYCSQEWVESAEENAVCVRILSPQFCFAVAFVNFQKQQTLIKDTDGYLKCSVIGYPEPTVKWKKLGQVLPPDRFVHQGNGDLLLIKSVRESDGGVYTCNVEQDRKSDVKNVTVNIKGKS